MECGNWIADGLEICEILKISQCGISRKSSWSYRLQKKKAIGRQFNSPIASYHLHKHIFLCLFLYRTSYFFKGSIAFQTPTTGVYLPMSTLCLIRLTVRRNTTTWRRPGYNSLGRYKARGACGEMASTHRHTQPWDLHIKVTVFPLLLKNHHVSSPCGTFYCPR